MTARTVIPPAELGRVLDPLGLTSEEAVEAAHALGMPRVTAMEAYKALLREGKVPPEVFAFSAPEVVRTLREESSSWCG